MIKINDKKECCGCYGCQSVCPKQCIAMVTDHEGFAYPVVNESLCIECGLCEKVCPVLNRFDKQHTDNIKVIACRSRVEPERLLSSSGGVFSLLASETIKEGGIVFAARFDNDFSVIHSGFTTLEELPTYRGSKYIQSRVGECYAQAKKALESGRKVMFIGTPCQIAGLKHSLRREYSNLLAVEIICHGVPSPAVFRKYTEEVTASGTITAINFRDKTEGWARYSLKIAYTLDGKAKQFRQPAYQNPYMRGFIKGLYLRPSCYDCPAKDFHSGCDITLADYWGIDSLQTNLNDDKGVSMVLTYSECGEKAMNTIALQLEIRESSLDHAKKNNPAIHSSVAPNLQRGTFFKALQTGSFTQTVALFVKPADPSLRERIYWRLKTLKNKIIKQ